MIAVISDSCAICTQLWCLSVTKKSAQHLPTEMDGFDGKTMRVPLVRSGASNAASAWIVRLFCRTLAPAWEPYHRTLVLCVRDHYDQSTRSPPHAPLVLTWTAIFGLFENHFWYVRNPLSDVKNMYANFLTRVRCY